MKWGLGNFITKKSVSPASASPFKSPSPAASISHKDEVSSISEKNQAAKEEKRSESEGVPSDSKPSRTLEEIGSCNTLGFDLDEAANGNNDSGEMLEEDGSKREGHNAAGNSDGDDENDNDDDESWVPLNAQKKRKSVLKESKKSGVEDKPKLLSLSAKSPKAKDVLKTDETRMKSSSSLKAPDGIRSKPSSLFNKKKKKQRNISSPSSSENEIDVVSFTPDVKGRNRSMDSASKTAISKEIKDVAKTLFTANPSDSEEDGEADVRQNNSSSSQQKKQDWRKIKTKKPISPLSSPPHVSPTHSMTTGQLSKTPRKLVGDNNNSAAFNHLESICKPLNLLSPLHSASSPTPSHSTKPLPSFQKSFSPVPQSSVSTGSPAPPVTLSNVGEPQIIVRIPLSGLSGKKLAPLRERKTRKSSPSKDATNLETNGAFSSVPMTLTPESRLQDMESGSKGHRVPPIGGDIASCHDTHGSKEVEVADRSGNLRKSSSSSASHGPSSKPPKHKIDPGGDAQLSSISSSISSTSSNLSLCTHQSPSLSSLSSRPSHKLPKNSKISPGKDILPPLHPSISSATTSSSLRSPMSPSNPLLNESAITLTEAANDKVATMSSYKKSSNSNSSYHNHQQSQHQSHHSSNHKRTPPSEASVSSGSKRSSSSSSSNNGVSSAKNPSDLGSSETDRTERSANAKDSKGLSVDGRPGKRKNPDDATEDNISAKRVRPEAVG